MIYKIQTDTSIETIKKELQGKAKALGFGVLGSYNFKEILKSKGFEIEKEITVYELCNPPAATEALNTLPDISVYLPCRLSVYEQNGITTLATIGLDDMLNAVDVDSEFKKHLGDIFDNIKALMQTWKGIQ